MLWFILAIPLAIATGYLFGAIAYQRNKDRVEAPNDDDDRWYVHRYTNEDLLRSVYNGRINGWIFGTVFFLFAAFVTNLVFDQLNRVPEDRYTTLVSMGDAAGVKGRFFLGSGQIETNPVYMYYWSDGGAYRLAHVDASSSYITYTDETPTLVHHGSHQRYGNWFSIGSDDWSVDQYSNDAYEFKIPPGSIAQQYVLDAQ